MSKKPKKTTKFSYIPNHPVPKLKKIITKWDLSSHYYTSENDQQIEKDLKKTEAAYCAFAKKFKNSDFTSNPKTLLAALTQLDKINLDPSTGRPSRYFGLRSALNSGDEVANKRSNLISDRLTKAGNELLFFELALGKVSPTIQKRFLKDPDLSLYRYYLTRLFDEAKYDLTEPEEKILRLVSEPSYGMWVDATEKMLGKKTITYKGKSIPLNEAIDTVGSVPFAQKPILWEKVTTELSTLTEVVENELTAICTRKKVGDELRGFKKAYSATVLNYEDNERSIESLVKAVSTEGFENSRNFFTLKAQLHGVKKLDYSQRGAPIGDTPKITFEQSVEICRDVFYSVKTEYGKIFDRLLENGQIDVHPKAGKRGGAFMSGQTAQPTKVFLNHVDTMRSLETLAHEMGHAIHTERAKQQPAIYQGYSTTTAETASTLFEGLLFDAIYAQANDDQKIVLLHDKIAGDISTIERQIAFFNFELDMHNIVRTQGAITKSDLNALMQKHLRSYMGPAVEITEADGHSYVYVGHFRYGFYVYTYTFGILMSSIFTQRYQKDPSYIDKIDAFLSSGCSKDVVNTFKIADIDTTTAKSFTDGLKRQKMEIELLKKLTQK